MSRPVPAFFARQRFLSGVDGAGAGVSAAGRGRHGAGGAGRRGAGTGGGAPLPRAARGFYASLTKTDGKITENTSIF